MVDTSRGLARIVLLLDGRTATTSKVFLKFEDGSTGRVEIPDRAFIDAGNEPMGQILLQCWLAGAE